MATEWATNYHATVNELRTQLFKASLGHHSTAEKYAIWNQASSEEGHAFRGNLMASSYSYALAALLRVAHDDISPEAARTLAFELDEILTNGDFNRINSDLGEYQ